MDEKAANSEALECVPRCSNMLDGNDTSKKVPKKRGRSKKVTTDSSDAKPTVAPPIVRPDEEQSFKTSKRGRKRKEVNYLSLVEEEEEEPPRKRANNNKRGGAKASSSNCDNADEEGESERKPTNSNYRKTGIRKATLTQLFNTTTATEADAAAAGRSSVKEEIQSALCMACNQAIADEDWPLHKQNVHYDLAWRKGETALDVTNEKLVLDVIAGLQTKQGHLKCHKCNKKSATPKKFLDHLEACNQVVSAKGMVTCAVCRVEVATSTWSHHKYKEHNNLAWREGDPPLDLNDRDLVMKILNQLYKARKPLRCELCKQIKKSVLGYLSHKSVCQKKDEELESVKVACTICGHKVLPVSMDYHLKKHTKPAVVADDNRLCDRRRDNGVVEGSRKAAQKALKMITAVKGDWCDTQQYYSEKCDFEDDFIIGVLKKRPSDLKCVFEQCDFANEDIEQLIDHMKSCGKQPEQYFICKLCLVVSKDEPTVKAHLTQVHKKLDTKDAEFCAESDGAHSSDDQYTQEVEDEMKRLRKKKKLIALNDGEKVKPIFLIHPQPESSGQLVYPQAFTWNYDFCEKHYSNGNLFDDMRNGSDPWPILDTSVYDRVLPRGRVSCEVTAKPIELRTDTSSPSNDFRQFEMLEAHSFYDGEATVYCGGPVTSLAWLPTNYDGESEDQILAVAVLNQHGKEYAVGQVYREPYVVQVWNCGPLKWTESKQPIRPSFMLGLMLFGGPVWHLEWCPSGCFDSQEGGGRLGLLAVAAADSFVYIYSIDRIQDERAKGLLYKGEPVLKLQLDVELPKNDFYYPTRLSWTKAKGHRYVAVGYSNGFVAFFDLLATSPLLVGTDAKGVKVLLPYERFSAGISCITALTLLHYEGGNRYCFVGGLDKSETLWDMLNRTKVSSSRKFGVSEGLWLTHWPVAILAEDESSCADNLSAHTVAKTIRSGDNISLTDSPSGLNSVSFSDWLNMVMHGGNCGDISVRFLHRMFFNLDKKRLKNYTKCLLSVAKLIEKRDSDDSKALPITYGAAVNRYKLAFFDYNSSKLQDIPNSKTNKTNPPPIERHDLVSYPLRALTKVLVNPNAQACTYYACGYEAGFVRIRGMEFLEQHYRPVKLPGHAFSASL